MGVSSYKIELHTGVHVRVFASLRVSAESRAMLRGISPHSLALTLSVDLMVLAQASGEHMAPCEHSLILDREKLSAQTRYLNLR